jgi:hypothetical protein
MTGLGFPPAFAGVYPGSTVRRSKQEALEIAATIKNAENDNLLAYDPECNCCPTLKSDDPQSGADVVTTCTPYRRGLQSHAGGLNPIDVSTGNSVTRALGDVAIELE